MFWFVLFQHNLWEWFCFVFVTLITVLCFAGCGSEPGAARQCGYSREHPDRGAATTRSLHLPDWDTGTRLVMPGFGAGEICVPRCPRQGACSWQWKNWSGADLYCLHGLWQQLVELGQMATRQNCMAVLKPAVLTPASAQKCHLHTGCPFTLTKCSHCDLNAFVMGKTVSKLNLDNCTSAGIERLCPATEHKGCGGESGLWIRIWHGWGGMESKRSKTISGFCVPSSVQLLLLFLSLNFVLRKKVGASLQK